MEKITWPKELNAYQRPSLWRSLWQFSTTFLLYIVMWVLMYKSLSWSYGITLLLAIPTAGLLIRLFIFNHDCGHGSFLKNKTLQRYIGRIGSFLTFTPYYFWKEQHAIHHRTTGNLDYRNEGGDVWMMTTREYQSQKWFKKLCYRIYRNPVLYLGIISPIYFIFVLRFNFARNKKSLPNRKKLRNSVYLTNLALLLYSIVLSLIMGFGNYVAIQLPILVCSSAAGVWMFYVQHQYEGVYWKHNKDWDFNTASVKGSSYYKLPKIFQWFTGNIGFHHIHHMNPRVPNYFLEKCQKASPLFSSIQPLTFWKSLKMAALKLWDEEKEKMVGFKG